MAIAIGEILKLKGCEGCIVLAGENGLDNVVEHVLILEEPAWEQGFLDKTIALSTTKNIPSSEQCRLLMRKGVTALAVIGPECPELSPENKTLSDQCFFPVLYIPGDNNLARYVAVILNEIVERGAAEAERRRSIHRRFTEVAVKAGSLTALATTLYQLIGKPVAIYDNHLEQRIVVPEGHPVLHGYSLDLPQPVNTAWQPIRLPANPPKQAVNLVVTAVVLGEEVYGYLVVAEGSGGLDATELVAIDHATIMAALELVREKATLEARQSLCNDLIDEILNSEVNDEVRKNLILRSRSLGWDLEQKYLAVALGIDGMERYYDDNDAGSGFVSWRSCVEKCLRIVAHKITTVDHKAIVASHSDMIILLSSVDPSQSYSHVRKKLVKTIAGVQKAVSAQVKGIGLTAGIGESVAELLDIGVSYQEAKEALVYGRATFGPGSVTCFDELGLYRLLFRFPKRNELEDFYRRTVGKIMENDEQEGSQLIATLEALVKNDGHMQKTAQSLFIHYNTLKYRLKRIAELTGQDWNKAEGRLNLHVGLKLRRILEEGRTD